MTPGENLSKSGPDTATTQHFRVFAHGRELAPEQLPLQVAARDGVIVRDFEEELRFDDGSVVHVFGTAVPLRGEDGVPRGAIATFLDVTRLKQAEAALRLADQRKDEFLAILSHELRNPLAPILTAAQLMKLRGDVATPRERELITRQAQHLVRLVDDLLDVSRVTRGKIALKKERLELAHVVAKAVEAVSPLLEQRKHVLQVAAPAEGLAVDGDEVRLTQVVSNLLSNAARYTPPGGHIAVAGAREGDHVVLRVRDDGTGITPELMPQLFEMFVQGPRGPDRAEGGLGLGLALVRRLTELHGGTVEAHSDGPGRGSEFTVRLDAAPELPPVLQPPAGTRRPSASGRALRVLVVDDNRDAAELISEVLQAAGYAVETAGDPSSALLAAERFRPHLAVLDIGLPVMDGYELGQHLRARMGTAAPALIALTGYGQEQDKQRSQSVGFAFHLVKPIDSETLLQCLAAAAPDRAADDAAATDSAGS
jgi:signal transduction histidine kinase/ActR/RegA family two-component response regulator